MKLKCVLNINIFQARLLMLRNCHRTLSVMSRNKKCKQEVAADIDKKVPISINKTGEICIKIMAKPGAKQNSISEICEDHIKIQIAAPPVEGEANVELVKYISKLLKLRKSDVSLDKGAKSRQKIVLITKDAINIDNILKIFKEEVC